MRLRMTISFVWMLNSEVLITRGGSVVTDCSVFVLCKVEGEVEVLQQAQEMEGEMEGGMSVNMVRTLFMYFVA